MRRVSVAAVFFLVALRVCIGWQFFYEGIWKLGTQNTARPWSSAGYLRNAQGPFRSHFRDMTGDPDELGWLDVKTVEKRWDDWHRHFINHYGLSKSEVAERENRIAALEKNQKRSAEETSELTRLKSELADDTLLKRRVDILLNGQSQYFVGLEQLPDGVDLTRYQRIIRYDAPRKLLIVDGKMHITPRERERLKALVTVEDDPAPEDAEQNEIKRKYQEALNEVYKRSSRLSYKEQLRASLSGDPDRATQVSEEYAGTIDHRRLGKIDLYQEMLDEYETNLAAVEQDFERDHLDKQWAEIQQLRVELTGPIKALDAELKNTAHRSLKDWQLARGPLNEPKTQLQKIDWLTMWSLTILGLLLIAGFFTRPAAVAGALLVLSFYLVMPPWPGVPEPPGPEHSFLINKNFIECIALLAIAMLPTGSWFGLDGLFSGLYRRWRSRRMMTSSSSKSSRSRNREPAIS